MRTIHTRKRSYGGNARTTRFKRRRVIRRRVRRTARNKTYTNRASGTVSYRPRALTARRRRQFRRNLWNSTDVKQKYKAIFSVSDSLDLGTTTTVSTKIHVSDAIQETNPFWTVGGGLMPVNFGSGAPSLAPNKIYVRGGMIECTIGYPAVGLDAGTGALAAQADDINICIQLVYVKQQRRNYTDANNVSPNAEWTSTTLALWPRGRLSRLQDEPDYEQYYWQPVLERSANLKVGDSITLTHKLKPKRIDADQFNKGFGMFPRWIVYMTNNTNDDTVRSRVEVTKSYRLFFTVEDI